MESSELGRETESIGENAHQKLSPQEFVNPVTSPAMAPVASPAPFPLVPPVAPTVSHYTDFRIFLRDVYEFRRQTESTGLRAYSYSTFSAAADIKSPNYLRLIIDGRRNLSDDMIARFARALRLNKSESEEFKVLVLYGQASDPMQRNRFLKELADLRAKRAQAADLFKGPIEGSRKVPGWMGWVLYAMTEQSNVRFDPDELYRLFRVKTSPEDIRAELQRLIDRGDLKPKPESESDRETGAKDKATVYEKGRELLDARLDVPVEMIRKLQAELIYLGIESLFRDSPKEREFGAMTIAMTQAEFEHVRFELRQLRKRLQKDLMVKRAAGPGDRVYQMNIQLFPVTDKVESPPGT